MRGLLHHALFMALGGKVIFCAPRREEGERGREKSVRGKNEEEEEQ